jgi:hypothetical protein
MLCAGEQGSGIGLIGHIGPMAHTGQRRRTRIGNRTHKTYRTDGPIPDNAGEALPPYVLSVLSVLFPFPARSAEYGRSGRTEARRAGSPKSSGSRRDSRAPWATAKQLLGDFKGPPKSSGSRRDSRAPWATAKQLFGESIGDDSPPPQTLRCCAAMRSD